MATEANAELSFKLLSWRLAFVMEEWLFALDKNCFNG